MLSLEKLENYTKEVGEQFIAPITESVDKEGRFPKEAYEALKQKGFMGLLVPKEYGGLGGTCLDHAKVCFHLGSFDASAALCYMMHNCATSCIISFGSQKMKEEFLPKIAKGEATLALAYSESGSGTHFGSPEISETKSGSKRILKGRKSFVTSALNADFYLTYTNSCEKAGAKNNWLVSSKLETLHHEIQNWDGLGMRGNSSMPVQYNDVELDESLRVGEEGGGENHAGLVVMYFVSGLAAIYSGLASATYNNVLAHTKNRKYTNQQAKALSDIELIRIHLADIYTKVESSKALSFEAARSFTENEADAAAKIFASRINATNNVIELCTLAMRLGGGKAYAKALPLERYLRDALASQVMAPSLDILRIWLGEALVK